MKKEQKEHGILFKPDMIRAIREGRKTMTRRIITNKLIQDRAEWAETHTGLRGIYFTFKRECDKDHRLYGQRAACNTIAVDSIYPKYQPGDLLWVREAWCPAATCGYDKPDDNREIPVWYKATDSGECEGPWKSARFMFKKFARLWLEVLSVKVERVQDISEEDARAEGFNSRDEFFVYWDILNKKRGYGVEANPWVWGPIEFRRKP